MTSGRYGLILREVGRLLGGGTAASLGAGPLLERFAVERDGAAFEALVGRHGPMVLGTCRRMLSDPHDVDDAFQATFLVLARKAGSIQDPDRLGPWLHGVARRVAARSRALAGRRRSVEQRSAVDEPAAESPDPLEEVEVREALDDELSRLPEKYRAPLVLCYLEGLTHDEAADQLRWPVGTVRSRLSGGRDRLRAALTRRGLAPSAAVPAILVQTSIPQALLSATVRVATAAGSPSVPVLHLAKGVLIAMTFNKLQLIAALGLTAALTVGGAGLAAQQGGAGKVEAKAADAPTTKERPEPDRAVLAINEDQLNLEMERLNLEAYRIVKNIKEVRSEFEARLIALDEAYRDINSRSLALAERWKKSKAEAASTDDGNRMARLEKQVAEQSALIRSLQGRGDAPGDVPVDQVVKAAPVPDRPVDAPKLDKAGSPEPAATTVVNLDVVPPLFAMIAGGGSRVTMVDPVSKRKATCRLIGGFKTTITPFDAGGDLFPMGMVSHKVSQLAIFDRAAWRWSTIDLGGSVAMARPDARSNRIKSSPGLIGFSLDGPEITKVVAYDTRTHDWISQDLKEPASGNLTPSIYPEVLACPVGRFVYAYSVPAKKWATLELKRPIRWGQPGDNFAPKGGLIAIPEEDTVHVFDVKTGEWRHIDVTETK